MKYTFFNSFNFINNPRPGRSLGEISAAFGGYKKKFLLSLLFLIGQVYAQGQSCDCPPVTQCGACQGGITSLTLRYDGLLGLGATITADDDGPGVLFSGWVDSGSTFTITGSNPDGTFNGDEVNLSGLLINADITTSCGTSVYVNSTYGNFTVVAGLSKDGGQICCAPADMETIPPVISNCPADIQLAVASSECSAIVNWTAPTATDNCGSVVLTSTHSPGDTFSEGSTSVVYTATDDYGNTSTCSFNVIVDDDTDPVIAGCPASDIIVNADASCEATGSWTAPTASDNCGAVTLTSTHSPGDVFQGTTIVTYTATDAANNTSFCSFNVIVSDNTSPTIAGCPASDIIATANTSCEATVSWPVPTASDNCGPVTMTSTHNPDDIFSFGTTSVTYTATDDAGNTSVCTFNVVVNDETAPVITGCPVADIVAVADASCQAIVSWTAPAASDNCGPLTLTSSNIPGDVFPLGTTVVTYTATDGAGNTSTCTFNVVVNDDTDPVITGCPSDITISANASCEAIVSWTVPTASDNCGAVTLTSTHSPGDVFQGTTIVTYTATDAANNTSVCTFNVIVNDDAAPLITGCPTSDVVAVANASCEATVSWVVPVASDNCGSVTLTSSKNPGDVFSLGTTVITYSAMDDAGNTSICTFNVIVNDNTDPVITGCPSDIIVSANGSCEAVVTWTAPTISDNCGPATITTNHNPGEIFPLGTTVVLYTATDGDNISTCSFNVVVNDDTDPVITGCITSDIVVTVNGACQATANWIRPTATDNCGAATLTASHNPGNFAVGTTQVTYTATDGFGNTSTCSFNVIVQDVTNPVISGCVSSDIIVSANAMCQALASWTPPTATDNCGSVTMTSSHAPGSLFPLGTTTVTYTATDGSDNTSTCTFNVIVKDETGPVLSDCPATDIVVNANASCQAVASWTPPTATDNCSPVTLTSTHAPGATFTLGTTQVTYTAKDDDENMSTCSFNVIVVDVTAPVITGCITSDIIVSVDASCQGVVNWTAPSATDNCGPVTLTASHNPGDSFPLGTTTVTYTASDPSENISKCTFNVIVTDTDNPVISGCTTSDIIAVADATCKAAVNWVVPTATDNCGTVTLLSSHVPGDYFDMGTTIVTYTATDDSGNISTCAFNVIVEDEIPPILTGCSDVTTAAGESCETKVSWTPPAVTDCELVTLTSSHASGDLFPVGTTEVMYTATDKNGNIASCKFNVIVDDKTSPVFQNCPEEIVMLVDNGCDAIVSWVEPTATDNCGGVTLTKSHAPGDIFYTGTTTVKYTATDTYGNVSVCQFNVTVNIEMLPIIANCPVDINVNGNEYGEASVDWTPPTGTSACGEVVLTSTYQPGDAFSLGTTVVEYKAEDTFGNVSYCRFNVVVTRQEIDIDISKVVTPDGNGVNDEWIVTNIEKFNDNKVVIVDRWGSVIYTASGYNNVNVVWKGVNRNGGTVPTGTYFYTISVRYGPSVFEKSGFIELIR